MTARNWTDQPDVCELAEVLWSVHANGKVIEIRALAAPDDPSLYLRTYLVTVGNLFGSQTVRCHGEDKLFELLRLTSKKNPNLPDGCELLEANSEEAKAS